MATGAYLAIALKLTIAIKTKLQGHICILHVPLVEGSLKE